MVKALIIKNSLFGLIQFVITAILTFISIPLFIGKLGFDLYGVWAVIAVVGNLNILTNFGLNKALVVFVARQGKSKESDFDIAVTQFILLLITSISTIFIYFNKAFIINSLFSIPSQYSIESQKLLVLLVLANGLLLFGQTFTSVIDAKQKMYITNICQLVYSLIYWVSQIVILYSEGGLYEIGLGALFAALIWIIIVYIFYKNIWGKLNLHGLYTEIKNVAIKQLSYGGKIFVSGIIGFMFEPLSKILLSNFIGVDAVALFEIGLRVKNKLNGLLVKLLNPFFPYIAQEKNDKHLHSKINNLILKIQLLVIPISIVLIFVMQILIKLWLGDTNLFQITLFVITMTVTIIALQPSVFPVYQFLQSKDLAEKTIWIQLASVLFNALVFITSYDSLGVYAILVSNSLGLLAAYLMCNYYMNKYLGFSVIKEVHYYLKLLALIIILFLPCLMVRYYLEFGIWDLIIYPAITTIGFVFSVRKMKLLCQEDLNIYFGTIPYLKNKLEKFLIS